MKFNDICIYDFFIIPGFFGEVELMKINEIEGICINSKNGTYQRGVRYAIERDTEIIKTN